MANKVILGKTPEIPVQDVQVTLLDGTQAIIPCYFIYRTHTQFGAFMDELEIPHPEADSAKDASASTPDQSADSHQNTWKTLFSKGVQSRGKNICKVLKGWGLDIPFTEEAAAQLVDEIPGSWDAIFSAYQAAIINGRLGNSVTPPASISSDS